VTCDVDLERALDERLGLEQPATESKSRDTVLGMSGEGRVHRSRIFGESITPCFAVHALNLFDRFELGADHLDQLLARSVQARQYRSLRQFHERCYL
jgi:hypothetical protein